MTISESKHRKLHYFVNTIAQQSAPSTIQQNEIFLCLFSFSHNSQFRSLFYEFLRNEHYERIIEKHGFPWSHREKEETRILGDYLL